MDDATFIKVQELKQQIVYAYQEVGILRARACAAWDAGEIKQCLAMADEAKEDAIAVERALVRVISNERDSL